jgi:hypothetical protein
MAKPLELKRIAATGVTLANSLNFLTIEEGVEIQADISVTLLYWLVTP